MKLNELKVKLKTKDIPHLLIFTGEEIQVQKLYRNQISKVLELPIIICENVTEVYKKITNKSFITKNTIYFVFDDMDFIKDEKALDAIKNKLKDNYLILQYSKIDKRLAFYKKCEAIEFEKLDSKILLKYIQKECQLSEKNILKLIDICNNDYSRILLELDKIKSLGIEDNEAFEHMLKEGSIYIPPYDAIFDWVDAVMRKQFNRANKLLKISYSIGENTLTLLSGLYLNVKQVLQVQSCQSQDICSSTGLTYYQVKCTQDKCGFYSIKELVDLLKEITNIEQGIKTGQIEEELAIPYLMSTLY